MYIYVFLAISLDELLVKIKQIKSPGKMFLLTRVIIKAKNIRDKKSGPPQPTFTN